MSGNFHSYLGPIFSCSVCDGNVTWRGMLMQCRTWGVPGVAGTLRKANSHFDPIQTGSGPHHHVEAGVDSCISRFLLLVLERFFLLALPLLLGICFPSHWSLPFSSHSLSLISVYLIKMRFSLTLALSIVMIWYSGHTALFLLAKATLAYLPTALYVALRSIFLF